MPKTKNIFRFISLLPPCFWFFGFAGHTGKLENFPPALSASYYVRRAAKHSLPGKKADAFSLHLLPRPISALGNSRNKKPDSP